MSTPPFRVEPLADHERGGFSCGVADLDRYFQTQITQDIRRRVAAGFVAVEAGTERIAGYYTLSASSAALSEIPAALAKKLPRYPIVPVALIGRLAIDRAYQGRKLGSALLFDAASRAAKSDVAVFALLVDAKDAGAEAFYRHHGFVGLGGNASRLVVSLAAFGAQMR